MTDDALQRNNAGIPCETGSRHHTEKLTLSALIKHII